MTQGNVCDRFPNSCLSLGIVGLQPSPLDALKCVGSLHNAHNTERSLSTRRWCKSLLYSGGSYPRLKEVYADSVLYTPIKCDGVTAVQRWLLSYPGKLMSPLDSPGRLLAALGKPIASAGSMPKELAKLADLEVLRISGFQLTGNSKALTCELSCIPLCANQLKCRNIGIKHKYSRLTGTTYGWREIDTDGVTDFA